MSNLLEICTKEKTDVWIRRYDNTWALHQIEEGHHSILSRAPATDANKAGPSKHGKTLPRVMYDHARLYSFATKGELA